MRNIPIRKPAGRPAAPGVQRGRPAPIRGGAKLKPVKPGVPRGTMKTLPIQNPAGKTPPGLAKKALGLKSAKTLTPSRQMTRLPAVPNKQITLTKPGRRVGPVRQA